MTQLEMDTERSWAPYVPPLQRTEGQPPPIAANGGLSYMSFDQDGDAVTTIDSVLIYLGRLPPRSSP